MKCLCFVRGRKQHFINYSGFENVLLQGMAKHDVDWDLHGIHCDDEQNHLPYMETRDRSLICRQPEVSMFKRDMKSSDAYARDNAKQRQATLQTRRNVQQRKKKYLRVQALQFPYRCFRPPSLTGRQRNPESSL